MAQYISVKRKQQTNKHAPLAIMLCLLFLFSSFTFSFADSSLPLTDLIFIEIINSNKVTYESGVVSSNNGAGVVLFAFGNYDIPSGSAITLSGTISILSNDSDYSDINFRLLNEQKQTLSTIVSCYPVKRNDTSKTVNATFTYTDDVAYIGVATNSHVYSFDLSNLVLEGVPSGGGGVAPTYATIIVNPGNVAYIGYDEGYVNITARTSKAMRKYNGNARIGYTSSRPSSNSQLTFTSSTGSLIDFTPVQPFDLAHRTTVHMYHEELTTTAYLVVYNPIYDADGNANLPLNVGVSNYLNVVQFPLTATIQNGEIISQGDVNNFYASQGADMMPEAGTPEYVYSQTDSQGNVTTSTAISVPTSPYNYLPATADNDTTMRGFIERILNILSAPLEHIQRLYNSAINFFNYLTSLWSWLPTELTSVIISALVVLVVIGVVKFLWK